MFEPRDGIPDSSARPTLRLVKICQRYSVWRADPTLVVDDRNWDLKLDTKILIPDNAEKQWTPLRKDCESRQLEDDELSP